MCFAWQGLLASYPLACFMLLGVTPPLDGRSPSLKHSWKDVCLGGLWLAMLTYTVAGIPLSVVRT